MDRRQQGGDTVDAVILCKDGDDDAPGRRAGLEQARNEGAWPMAVKDAKRVLDELTAGDHERAEHDLVATSLAALRERGEGNGLADYLDEVTTRLAPLLGARSGDAP